jgi:hypothetical protein
VTASNRQLRMRMRPKVILAHNYAEAERAQQSYGDNLLSVITDVQYDRAGKLDDEAGVRFMRQIRKLTPVKAHFGSPHQHAPRNVHIHATPPPQRGPTATIRHTASEAGRCAIINPTRLDRGPLQMNQALPSALSDGSGVDMRTYGWSRTH